MLYPINLDIKDKRCLVVGGGAVASRKVASLVRCGARVDLVSPSLHPPLKNLYQKRKVSWFRRHFRPNDVRGRFLIIAATDDRSLNHRISRLARHHRVLVNVIDQSADCTFTVPSVLRRGHLTITISTEGRSPTLSKRIRQELSRHYGPEFGRFLQRMGKERKKIIQQVPSSRERKRYFEKRVKEFFQR